MKKLIILIVFFIIAMPVNAFGVLSQEQSVKNVLQSQVKYANRGNLDKFLATFDENYLNADGFNLEVYSQMVKDIWETYENIKYGIKIKNINIYGDTATVEVTENSDADLTLTKNYTGKLNSISESVYYLKKVNGKWKVVSDKVLDETTTMLYGDLRGLDIKLTVPNNIKPDTEYTASLEFIAPKNMVAIASLAADKVTYPQQQTKEVFRAMPEDNILERLFTSNNDNVNEYIVASIGLTQTDICDLSIKMSLTGFGYIIKRVNVVPANKETAINDQIK